MQANIEVGGKPSLSHMHKAKPFSKCCDCKLVHVRTSLLTSV